MNNIKSRQKSIMNRCTTLGLGLLAVFSLQLSAATAQAATYFYHNDHLGTPQVLTDENQTVVWQGDYDPFGQATETVNTVEQNLRFPGQYLDRESGLHYNYFRTYDPVTGRYTQSDPIGLGGGINTYGYAHQNSINYIDPNGLNPAAAGAAAVLFCARNPRACMSGAFALCRLTGNCEFPEGMMNEEAPQDPNDNDQGGMCPTPDNPSWLGDDPTVAPPGTIWKGAPGSTPGDEYGNYHNPETGESYRPDLEHEEPIGPHWDYHPPRGSKLPPGRFFPDGSYAPKR